VLNILVINPGLKAVTLSPNIPLAQMTTEFEDEFNLINIYNESNFGDDKDFVEDKGVIDNVKISNRLTEEQIQRLKTLLNKYHSLFSGDQSTPNTVQNDSISHKIDTSDH
jgi:hypothetical protein